MSARRITVDTIGGGQRPYGPTVRRYRIIYEWQGMAGYKNKDAPFVRAEHANEELVRRDAKHFGGWTDELDGDHFSTRLTYFKMVEPGMWEWETSAAYDD